MYSEDRLYKWVKALGSGTVERADEAGVDWDTLTLSRGAHMPKNFRLL